MDLDLILGAVGRRPPETSGIALASAYTSSLAACLGDGGECAARFGGPALAGGRWERAVKESARRLVYTDPDLGLESGLLAVEGGSVKEARAEPYGKELTPGACMDFACVLTSTRKDRDADVLESGGAELDPSMPLLWQHVPLLPIGRQLGVLSQDEKRVRTACSVIDSKLGNDAAQLVEFGALGISHGFIPTDYAPLRAKAHDPDPRDGWHVRRFKVVETSLVSVRSNEDAAVTAWSRGKLGHPLVKAWAEGVRKGMPRHVNAGWEPSAVPAPSPLNLTIHFGPPPGSKALADDAASGGANAAPVVQGACACGKPDGGKCGCGKATTDEWKCPDCLVKLKDGKCPKCGYEKPAKAVGVKAPGDEPSGEHACRLGDPSKYDQFRRKNTKTKAGKPVGTIFGRLKGKGDWELASIRYPADSWTEAEARKACDGQDGGKFMAAAKAFRPAGATPTFFAAGDLAASGEPEGKQAGEVLMNDRSPMGMPHLDGSHEERIADLQSQLPAHMKEHGAGKGMADYGDNRAVILGTFDDHAVVATAGYTGNGDRKVKTYSVPWEEGEDGEPVWSGPPVATDLVLTHSGTDAGGPEEKAGGVLAKAWAARAAGNARGPGGMALALLGLLLEGHKAGLDSDTALALAGELQAAAAESRRAEEDRALGALLAV